MSRPTNPKWRIFVGSGIDDAGLSPKACKVLMHLARVIGSKENGWPAAATMAKHCNMHRDTLFKALKELESAKLITRQRRYAESSRYRFNSPENQDDSRPENQDDQPDESSGKSGSLSSGKSGLLSSGKSGQKGSPLKEVQLRKSNIVDTAPELPMAVEATEQPPTATKPKRKTTGKTYQQTADLPDNYPPQLRDLMGEYLEHRREIKKPMTPRSWRMVIEQTLKYKPKAVEEAIQKTIQSGWIGLFIDDAHKVKIYAPPTTTDNPTHKPKGKSFLPATLEATTKP